MLRIVYAGSPDVSALPLKEMFAEKKHEIVAVITNPPSTKGRKGDLIPTPVEQVALEEKKNNPLLEILTPDKLDSSVRDQISALNPDILVCFAYGKFFGPKFMSLFRLGGINLHPSLLPKYRGCAPVPAAILNQEKETGITIQRIAQEMDVGNILLQEILPIEKNDNSETLLNKVSKRGCSLITQVLDLLEQNKQIEKPQDSSVASYCGMLEKEDGLIDWTKSANEIDAKIRAFYPWPGAFTTVNGIVLKIHSSGIYEGETQNLPSKEPGAVLGIDKKQGILIQTGNGVLYLTKLQWQAKKAMEWKDFLNGSKDFCESICGK